MTGRIGVGIAVTFLLLAAPAKAQQIEGVAIDRFQPSERGSDWFVLESLDMRGSHRIAFGAVGDYGHTVLKALGPTGDVAATPIEQQLFLHLGASIVLWDRARIAFNLPLLITQNGDRFNGFSLKGGPGVGDLRLGADVRLFGKYGGLLTGAAGMRVWLPTGSRDAFTSDGSVRVEPRILLAGDAGPLTYAGRLGYVLRPEGSLGTTPTGDELVFGAAIGARMFDKALTIGPELYGTTVVEGSNAAFKKKTTPVELLLGAHYRMQNGLRVGAGVGTGLSKGFGGPDFRGAFVVEWSPDYVPPPPPDSDSDGIADPSDACPSLAGPANADAARNGCPPPPDRDGDGIIDDRDACPDKAGIPSNDPARNGCPPPPPPPPDRDRDGVIDPDDACPDAAGNRDADPKKNGCPPPSDRDHDEVIDDEDACPDAAGNRDADPKKNGCPTARIEQDEIKITQRISFDINRATLRPESEPVLEAVLKILQEHQELKQVSVEGHTDERGTAKLNRKLSADRAAAVVQWLVKKGIDRSRLTSAGFGTERPIDSNETEAGRQNNRRVEFQIRSQEQTAGTRQTAPAQPAATPVPAPPSTAP